MKAELEIIYNKNEDTCVSCGETIPEGRNVCHSCEKKAEEPIPPKKECPCKNCVAPKRHLGCHGICKDYDTWITAHRKRKEAINNQNKIARMILGRIKENSYKAKKKEKNYERMRKT